MDGSQIQGGFFAAIFSICRYLVIKRKPQTEVCGILAHLFVSEERFGVFFKVNFFKVEAWFTTKQYQDIIFPFKISNHYKSYKFVFVFGSLLETFVISHTRDFKHEPFYFTHTNVGIINNKPINSNNWDKLSTVKTTNFRVKHTWLSVVILPFTCM